MNSVWEQINNRRFQSITQDIINKNFGINLEERENCPIPYYWLGHLVYTATVVGSNNGSKCNVQSLCSAHDLIAGNGDEKVEGNLRNLELVVSRISDTAISNKAVKIPMCYLLVPRGIREHMQEYQEVKVEVQVRALCCLQGNHSSCMWQAREQGRKRNSRHPSTNYRNYSG